MLERFSPHFCSVMCTLICRQSYRRLTLLSALAISAAASSRYLEEPSAACWCSWEFSLHTQQCAASLALRSASGSQEEKTETESWGLLASVAEGVDSAALLLPSHRREAVAWKPPSGFWPDSSQAFFRFFSQKVEQDWGCCDLHYHQWWAEIILLL